MCLNTGQTSSHRCGRFQRFSVIRAYTGRLLPCVVIHFVFNGIQAVALVVEPHLPKLTQAGEQAVGMLLRLGNLAI